MSDSTAKFKMTELNFRKNVDPDKRRNANKSILELNELKREYKQRSDDAESLTKLFQSEKEKLKDITLEVEQTRNQLSVAQEEIDSDYLPEGAQPRARIQARDLIAVKVAQVEAALDLQRKSTAKVSDQLMEAERRLFEADRNINRFAETLEDTILAIATIKELDKEKALKLKNMEEQTNKRKAAEKQAEEEALALQTKEINDLKQKKLKITEKLQNDAKKALTQSHFKTRDVSMKIKEKNDAKQQDRVEAVLELKANQAAVRAEIATLAEKHVKKVAAAKQKLEDEKDALLAKGLNPYVEFRKKDLAEEAQRREKKMRDAVEKNKEELSERLRQEEQFFEKGRQADRAAKEYELKFRDSQGRALIEEKNSTYIVQRTSDHVEILDPTGRIGRVDPSQVTQIADYSFGLGKSSRIPQDNMRKITEHIRQTLKVEKDELGEYRRLVNGAMKNAGMIDTFGDENDKKAKKAVTFEDEDEPVRLRDMSSLEGLASPAGAMPGIDPSATSVNFSGDVLQKSSLLKIAVEEDGEMVDPTAGISSAKKPKYPPAQLSKFERDALEKAKDRHRTRIEYGTEQIAGGRLFKGHAFVSKPDELVFKDFDLGKKYKKNFIMTNVSYTFNSFKLLDLDDDVIDFFIISYEKPGRMSAGVSCTLEIVFTPQINKDIITNMRFFTETGPVEVPLKCLIKRCAPRIVNPVIDFGRVIIGQKLNISLKIKNSQALDTEFEVMPIRDPAESEQKELEEEHVEDVVDSTREPSLNDTELLYRVQRIMTQVFRNMKYENPFPLSSSILLGAVEGYGATAFDIICAPLTVGLIEQQFCLKFAKVEDSAMSVDDIGELVKKEQVVTVSVSGEEVPIYVAEDTMDLKCTLYDRIYRSKVLLKNRAKQAYRVSIKVSHAFSKYVEVNPTMLFVQAKSSQSVNIKFTPTLDMLSKISYFTCPYESFRDAALTILPIEIQVVGQALPVYFMIRTSVCPSTVQISSSTLDFGKVYVGQQSSKTITLTNVSMLPQKIAFVRLKKEFSVKPNDGFAVLLPNESTDFEVSFSPISAIDYDVEVTIITSLNDSYSLKVLAEGVDPPLEISTTVVLMRTTSPGERVLESVMVTNKSSHSQSFEVSTPDSRFSWFKVSPAVVQLAAGASSRLEIEYLPPTNLLELNPQDWYKDTLSAEGSVTPFDEFVSDSGWVVGKGVYGEMSWYQPPSEDAPPAPSSENQDGQELNAVAKSASEGVCDLSPEEWGVIGKWSIPIMLKSKRKAVKDSTSSASSTVSRPSTSSSSHKGAFLAPLFISVQTAVNIAQVDADLKLLDFGQISVGTRNLKSFKIFNRTFQPIRLKSVGLNALGPFLLIRPVKEIGPRESLNVIVECLPTAPGLIVEVLEFSSIEEGTMGHRVLVTLKVQGLKPSIVLEKLSPPPPNWSSNSGILDFGNCLMLDNQIVKKFTIQNKSTFTIDARIIRVVSDSLSPGQQAALLERTAAGLPVFSFRPERVQIARGTAAEVEVTFRPDRGRFHPFREDLDIFIGKTDEVYRVGVIGRAWARQYLVTPQDPRDEAFNNATTKGVSVVEDTLAIHSSSLVRTASKESRKTIGVLFPDSPNILLRFPDPFDPDADPASYVESSSVPPPAGAKGGGKGAAVAPAIPPGSRQQVKRLNICSSRIFDNRPGSAVPGSFEILLSQEARASGLWALSLDKGNITPTSIDAAAITVDITCTLPKPRSLGGVVVGSWKSFTTEIVIKGGWYLPGEPEENRIQVTLEAYVGL